MSDLMRITTVQNRTKGQFDITFLNHETATAIHRYHESFPVYRETPLVDLSGLAESLGVAAIYVKDESYRFGLNAFKVLGGSYAIGKVVANHLGLSLDELPFEYLISDEIRECLGEMTFITATDGNHGRGVAWTARQLHQKSIVYMPADTAAERAENIRKLGASVTIQDANYDECVRMADWLAKEKGYYIVQDTAWPGYEEIPRWIMQGYITMAYEAVRALEQLNQPITHVFLQAGVGSLASAVTGYLANVYPSAKKPAITIVEPETVACIYESARAGSRQLIGGQYETIMAGLACGEPNTFGLEVLLDYADYFIAASDLLAAHGMRILAAPHGNDHRIVSGESGAVTVGVASKILTDPHYADIKKQLGIDAHSSLLFFSTEGATDQKNYYDIVYDGKYPSGV